MDRGAGNHNRNLFAVLAALAALGLVVEGFAALVLSHGRMMGVDLRASVAAAAPGPAARPERLAAERASALNPPSGTSRAPTEQIRTQTAAIERPAPATEQGARPRIRLGLPRPALWPAPPAAETPAPVAAAPGPQAGRVSAAFIDGYLTEKSSPLMGLGSEFWERGRQYDVDPRLLVAISGNETGFGRILTSRYNAFNWFYRGTSDSHFGSWAEAIEAVARGIRQHYLDEGRITVAALGEKYGPIGAANDPQNLNLNFVPNVTALLREMDGDPEHLSFD